MHSITIPNDWFASTVLYTQNVVVLAFHKLRSFQSNYKRYIEKHIIITEGKKYFVN